MAAESTLGTRLRALRKQRGETLTGVSERLAEIRGVTAGSSYSWLRHREAGVLEEDRITIGDLRALARTYEMPFSSMLLLVAS